MPQVSHSNKLAFLCCNICHLKILPLSVNNSWMLKICKYYHLYRYVHMLSQNGQSWGKSGYFQIIVGNTEYYYYYSCIQLGTFFLITCIVLLKNVNVTVIVFFPLEWHPIWWTLFRDTSIGLINNCQLFQFSLEEIVGFII